MGVDEPRQEDPAVEVDDIGLDAGEELDVVAPAESHDFTVSDGDRLVRLVGIRQRVDQIGRAHV